MERRNYLMLLNILSTHPTPKFLEWMKETTGIPLFCFGTQRIRGLQFFIRLIAQR